jgi:hypothetical protein
MDFFDFIRPEELDDLPEDPHTAFIAFVRLAEGRLTARLREIGPSDQDTYEQIDDARYGFQNVVLGAAKKFEIEPFASLEMPTLKNHNNENYRQFRADLTHYITQIMLTTADRDRSTSVPLLDNTRQSIATYVVHLREAIDHTDLPDKKKANLHKLLDSFEKELERKRVRFVVVAQVVMAVLAAPGALVGSYDAVVRITNAIMREIGEAKVADDQQRKISFEEPVALLPPRKEKVERRASFSRGEMDDEIPF